MILGAPLRQPHGKVKRRPLAEHETRGSQREVRGLEVDLSAEGVERDACGAEVFVFALDGGGERGSEDTGGEPG